MNLKKVHFVASIILYLIAGAVLLILEKTNWAVVYISIPFVILIISRPKWSLYLFIFALFYHLRVTDYYPIYLIDIVGLMLIASAIIDVLTSKNPPFHLPKISINYVIITVALVLSGLFSYNPQLSLTPILKSIFLILIFLSVLRLSKYCRESSIRLFFWLCVINAGVNLVFFLQFKGLIRTFGFTAVALDDLLMLAAPLGFILYLFEKKNSLAYLISVFIILAGLIATQSRAPFLFALIAILLCMLAIRKMSKESDLEYPKKRIRKFILYGLTAIGVIMILEFALLQTFIDRFAEFSIEKPIGSLKLRLTLYGAAIDVFWKNPIFGMGPGTFRHVLETLPELKFDPWYLYVQGLSAHNLFLHYLAETGLIGTTAIVLLYYKNYRNSKKVIRYYNKVSFSPEATFLYITAFMILFTTFIEASWTWGVTSFLASLFIGLNTRYLLDIKENKN